MQCGSFINGLNRDFPNRPPGSNELARVIENLNEKSREFGLDPELSVFPVYSIQTSINIFVVASLLILFLCLAAPLIGLIGQTVLLILLVGDLTRPMLARVKPDHSTNLIYQIPARSKETQKIILTASLATDGFIDPPTEFSLKAYLITLYSLAVLPVVFQFWAMFSGKPWLVFEVIPLMALLTYLPVAKRKTNSGPTLNNCRVLLELAAVLAKTRPATTSVTIILTGSRSLNSGLLTVDARLKGTDLGYLINLSDFPDQRINISTSEGLLFPKPGDPFLTELLLEVAREKNIPTQTAKFKQMTDNYLFKLQKIKAITVTNPLLNLPGSDSDKGLRELLLGLIRKIDRPS